MRTIIYLIAEKEAKFNINYQHALSSVIYRFIEENNPNLADSLHYGKRFKFFNFSNLKIPRGAVEKDMIHVFKNTHATFNFSSPNAEILKATLGGMLQEGKVKLLEGEFIIEKIEIIETPKFGKETIFRTLSPIYIDNGENPKKDLLPTDGAWRERIAETSVKKYVEYSGRKIKKSMEIEEIHWFKIKRINIAGTWWRCANTQFKIKGDPELLEFIWNTGIGTKNSQGFGCVKVVDRKKYN